MIAPPKFLQKIKVAMGIVLNAINGPDVPIPSIPTPKRIKSGRAGIAVWLVIWFGLADSSITQNLECASRKT